MKNLQFNNLYAKLVHQINEKDETYINDCYKRKSNIDNDLDFSSHKCEKR